MSQTKKEKQQVPWNKGLEMNEDFCLSISKSLLKKWEDQEYVKKQHEKTHYADPVYREKLSKSQLKNSLKISQRQTGQNNSFFGKHHSEESKRLKSEKNKGYFWWTDGQTNIKSKVCPSGFYRGRSNKPRDRSGRFTFESQES